MSTSRRQRIVTTASAGVLALALTGGALALGSVLPAGGAGEAPARSVAVGAGATDLVCPGPPRLPTTATGDDIDYDAELGPGPTGVTTDVSAVVLGGGGATIGALGADEPTTLTGAAARLEDVTGPILLRAQPIDGWAPAAAARTWSRADGGDLRGLASATCAVPASSIWLVGGSTAVGTSAQLTITNSGDTPARVHLTGWSGAGPEPEPAPVLLAAGESRVVLLEAAWLADRIALHLQAEGGRITAAVQDSRLDGITPAGLDFVTAAAEPATQTLIGPVPLPGYSDDESTGPSAGLRILNPGSTAATVAVSVLGEDGEEEVAGAEELVVEAGTVTQIPLAARHAGSNGVRLVSDVPVTAAVELSQAGQAGVGQEADPDVAPVDIAWLPAAVPATSSLLPADAAENGAYVVNPGEGEARVALTPVLTDGREGTAEELTVDPGASAPLPDPPADLVAWHIDADVPVLASGIATADVADGRLLTALPATPDAPGEREITVDLTID